jgi:hypothetical protein
MRRYAGGTGRAAQGTSFSIEYEEEFEDEGIPME